MSPQEIAAGLSTQEVMAAVQRIPEADYDELLYLLRAPRRLVWQGGDKAHPRWRWPGLFEFGQPSDERGVTVAEATPTELGKAVGKMIPLSMSPRVILARLQEIDKANLVRTYISVQDIGGATPCNETVTSLERLLSYRLIIVSYSHIDDDYEIEQTDLGRAVAEALTEVKS